MGEANRRKVVRDKTKNWMYWSKVDLVSYIALNIYYHNYFRRKLKMNKGNPEGQSVNDDSRTEMDCGVHD